MLRPLRTGWEPPVLAATALLLVLAAPQVVAAFGGVPADALHDVVGARAFWDGANPYSAEGIARYGTRGVGGIGHPPTTFFWFLGFSRFTIRVASQALGLIVIVALFSQLTLVAAELRAPRPLLVGAFTGAAVLGTPFMLDHLEVGQISALISLAYTLGWYLLRRGEPVAAGVALGLATTFKFFPALMVLFLLVTGRLRAFVAAVVAWAAVAAIMTARLGLAAWPDFLALQSGTANQFIGTPRNGSVHGIMARLLSPVCEPGCRLLPAAVALGVVAAVVVLAVVAMLVRRAQRTGVEIDLPYSLVAIASYLVNPWVWEHYAVLLLLPIAVAAVALARARALAGLAQGRVAMGAGALLVSMALLAAPLGPRSWVAPTTPLVGRAHWALHLHETAVWLPHLLVGAVLAALIVERSRRSSAAAEPLQLPDTRG